MMTFRMKATGFGVVGSSIGYVIFDPRREDEEGVSFKFPLVNGEIERQALDREIAVEASDEELEAAGLPANPKVAGTPVGVIVGPGTDQFAAAVAASVSQALAALGLDSETVAALKKVDITSQIDNGKAGPLDMIATTAFQTDRTAGHDGSQLLDVTTPPLDTDAPAGEQAGEGEGEQTGGEGDQGGEEPPTAPTAPKKAKAPPTAGS